MKKNNLEEIIEILDFEETPKKVGRPKLADKETKKKSLIIVGSSFFAVILLLVFGYGTIFGFDNMVSRLIGNVSNANSATNANIKVSNIEPIMESITIKKGTARKVYLTVSPTNASNKTIKYESSNEDVAIVDNNGKVTGIKTGKATIKAITTDGSNKSTEFKIKVIKDSQGYCEFKEVEKDKQGVNYLIDCENADVKEIQYKVANGNYKTLTSKKTNNYIKLSEKELQKDITFKVIYYQNNSKVTKYSTKKINNVNKTTKKINGNCNLNVTNITNNSLKYDITCENASVVDIAYKIGKGSYVGIEKSNLADTIIYEESDITRIIYFKVEYKIDGSKEVKVITENNVISSIK